MKAQFIFLILLLVIGIVIYVINRKKKPPHKKKVITVIPATTKVPVTNTPGIVFKLSLATYSFGYASCKSSTGETDRWHNGIGTYPVINDTIYTDEDTTIPLESRNGWWKSPGNKTSYHINSDGTVVATFNCNI